MGEWQTISEVLKSLGVSSLFGPVLALIILAYTIKKYILSGAGVFIREITGQYLKLNQERIILETKIDIKLSELTISLEKFITQLVDIEKRNSERIADVKRELSERLNNIEVVLSDKVFDEINELRRIAEGHKTVVDGKRIEDKISLAMMDTEEFRQRREDAKKEISKNKERRE